MKIFHAFLYSIISVTLLAPVSAHAGQVAYYPFENSAADVSGNGLHGNVMGNGTFVTGLPGFGKALSLDGTGTYVNVPFTTPFDFGTGGFTVSVMVKPTYLNSDHTPVISRWRGAWDLRIGWDGGFNNRLYGFIQNDPPGPYSSSSSTVTTGSWHHIVLRRDDLIGTATGTPSRISIFLDGTSIDVGNDARSADSSTLNLQIGKFTNVSTHYFQGLIDDVRIYDHPLSDSDIPRLTTPPNNNVTIHAPLTVDPRATFLRTASDPDALSPDAPRVGYSNAILNLATMGIAPGDYLFLERSGSFAFSPAETNEDGRNLLAIFSSSSIVEANPGATPPKRVPGALSSNAPPFVTANTFFGNGGSGFSTDIPEDFRADRAIVRVPTAATHLMLCAHDVFYGDNDDRTSPLDYQVRIVQVRDPSYDTDGDGASDLSEFLAGTDSADPTSHFVATTQTPQSPNTFRLQWLAQAFREYQVEHSDDVTAWTPIETISAGTTSTHFQRDYSTAPGRRFYRVRVTNMSSD